jgi:tetratricopeptide (TPR) repeat protein
MKETEIVPDYTVLEDDYLRAILDGTDKTPDVVSTEALKREKRQKAEKRRREKKKRMVMLASAAGVFVIFLLMAVIILVHQHNASSFDYQLEKADAALQAGDTKTAAEYYEAAMALEPSDVDVRLKLAKIYMAERDYDAALILYSEIIGLDPQNVEAYRNLISIYEVKGDVDSVLTLKTGITDPEILSLFDDYEVSAPSFDYESGTYEEYIQVSISADGAYEIYYTLDGTDPETFGTLYTEPIALDEIKSYELKAVCLNEKGVYSVVSTAKYTIEVPTPDMPVVTPDGGDYTEETLVSIEVPTGCSAYYTWDGTDPNITSNLYTEPFPVPEGNNVLSVLIIENRTEKLSSIYRQYFTYYPAD